MLILTCDAHTHTLVVNALLELLDDLGILCHPGKCELEQVESLSFLGMQLRIPEQEFALTDKQRARLEQLVDELLQQAKKQ